MVNVKTRIIIYYGAGSAAEAKERAAEIRSEGGHARLIDALNFSDIEDADKLEFIGVTDADKGRIEAAYTGSSLNAKEAPVNADGTPAIDIPENWADLSFPELQKLAAALSEETVRTKEAAIEIIEAELERRAAADQDEELDLSHLDDMTKSQLIEYAEDNEVDLGDATKKADIIAAIRAAAVPKE